MPDVGLAIETLGRILWMLTGGDRKRRPGLLGDYLRVVLADQLGRGGSPHRTFKPRQMRLRGFTVHYLDVRSLRITFEEIFVDEEYEARRPPPTILDLGGNIGLSVLYFKHRYPDCTVSVFEPDPTAFSYLVKNIESNGLAGVTLHNAAAADHGGDAVLYQVKGEVASPAMSLVRTMAQGEATTVKAVRLADQFEKPVGLVKIDVEGVERDLLLHLKREGKLALVDQFVIEYHHDPEGEHKLSDTLGTLEEAGFRVAVAVTGPRVFGPRQPRALIINAWKPDGPGERTA